MGSTTSRERTTSNSAALGRAPDTYSVHDKVLSGRMTAADLARVRFEILGEEAPPVAEEIVEIEVEPEPDSVRPAPSPEADRLGAIRRRIAAHDYGGAGLLAEVLLADEPDNAEAQRYLAACRTTLENIYLTHLGGDGGVPRLAVPPEQLRQLNPDRWAAFILSHVDGQSTIEDITDIAGMPRLDALRVLYELLQQGLIGITPSG